MVFNFDLLGLLILFILILVYYSKNTNLKSQTNVFMGMLVTSYIMQLLYIANFVAIKAGGTVIFFSKFYLMSFMLFNSLLLGYYVCVSINDKYDSKDSVVDKKITNVKYGISFINILSFIVVIVLKVKLDGNVISGSSVIFTYVMFMIYTIFEGIIILMGKNSINRRNFKNLFLLFVVNIVLLGVSFTFPSVAIINFLPIINILIMCLGIENVWVKENERLMLEHDYSGKLSLDKVKFLSNLSHEIRTPINVIDGFSQVLIESNDIESMKEDAKDIRVASKELIEIIDGLIDLATIENGKLELMLEDYNFYEMIDNIVNISNSRIKDKNIKFSYSLDKDIPDVLFGDQAKLEQVILNIINNSIKYTKKGEINLKVEAVKSRFMCRLKISIRDTGTGMKKEVLENIFNNSGKKENQADNSTGLGLIVSKKLLELMNGKLDINSTYGEGTEVLIVVDQKLVKDSSNVKKTRKKEVVPFDSKGKRILIVDDNKLNIKVAYKLLEPYNVKIEEVFSGQECLDLLDKDNDFDLILMDDLMPKMSGTETLEILRKIERIDGFYIPVVVLTANALFGVKNKYLDSGFDDYLAKPIDRYELDRVLRKYIKK